MQYTAVASPRSESANSAAVEELFSFDATCIEEARRIAGQLYPGIAWLIPTNWTRSRIRQIAGLDDNGRLQSPARQSMSMTKAQLIALTVASVALLLALAAFIFVPPRFD
jgi:hypothetical protein